MMIHLLLIAVGAVHGVYVGRAAPFATVANCWSTSDGVVRAISYQQQLQKCWSPMKNVRQAEE